MKKKNTFLFLLVTSLVLNAQTTIWEDNFESYPDFEIASIGNYTLIDNDGGTHYGSTNYDFTNEGYVGTAIIFNSSMTTPSAAGTQWDSHEGSKGLYFFASGANNTTKPNDDWVITPEIDLTNYESAMFSFWAKSITDEWGLERIEVAVSTTDTDPTNFTVISPGGTFEEIPTTYTEYSYDLSAYNGQQIYIAIHYVSNDSFFLQMDEFLVQGTSLSLEEFEQNLISYDFNQNTKDFTLTSETVLNSVSFYNILGQASKTVTLSKNSETIDLSELQSGIYIVKINGDNASKTIKLLIK
ncbi:MAG: T9SS type A sorting domain-containing protein [Flavobacteriaceae bacterium]|nr:T9SS type A sorting domain-containing protein [Flavobacteriaceae bacterium]